MAAPDPIPDFLKAVTTATPDPIPDLLKAVNDASGKAFALWITFLTVGIYLAIAIGTTTHLQLLLAGPVKLPLLGVDLPLFAFYAFAPPLFAVLHLYVLMQLYLLARLLRLFDDQLQSARILGQDRRMIRSQLDKFVFTQFLIGASPDGIVQMFLRAVVWLSFVVSPIILLTGFQLQFLPYHSIPVTYVHRVTLLLDFVLLVLMWPKISGASRLPHNRYALGRLDTAVLVGTLFALSVLAAPLLSHRLELVDERLVEPDEDKLSKLSRTLSLSNRDLSGAALNGSDLRKADLRHANLSGANLFSANLSGANLRVSLSGANLSGANLSGANLSGANLRVSLSGANVTGLDRTYAQMRADLTSSVSQKQLDTACGDAKTRLPDGMTIQLCPELPKVVP